MELRKIHKQFHEVLFNYINSRVHNRDDASDILQEVFIKVSMKIEDLKDQQKLKSWIFTITRNAIIDHYRKTSHAPGFNQVELEQEIMMTENDADTTKGLDKCLGNFIQKLPEQYRDIIIDSEIKGIRQKDLVDKYDIAYPSVRSRIQRGRKQLKELLLNCCHIEADSRGNIIHSAQKNNCDDVCGTCD